MLNYRNEELKERQKNTNELRRNLNENKIEHWLDEKIRNFCERHDLHFDLVRYKLLIDDVFVLSFIKEPSKQSLHQSLAVAFMEKIPNIKNFKLLPANGKLAKYVVKGMVVDGSQIVNSTVNVKSIDFEWTYLSERGESIQCYASHKYTYQGGGAQDQQFKELMTFKEHAREHQGQIFFYAICDGRYYQLPHENCLSKIDYLNKNYFGQRCHALNINDIEMHMLKNI